MSKFTTLVPILGDQLSPSLSSLRQADKKSSCVLMMEVQSEASYVQHHKKKLSFVFACMREFAAELKRAGWSVKYTKLTDKNNSGSLCDEIRRVAEQFSVKEVLITEAGEWRIQSELEELQLSLEPALENGLKILVDDRFLCIAGEFDAWSKGRKSLTMEYFYREMRKKTGLLMTEGKPEGGKWNYDADNRKRAPADLVFTGPKKFKPAEQTAEVIQMVEQRFPENFGNQEDFWFATTRKQAEAAFKHWLNHSLPLFGDYQDAMLNDERFLYHSIISMYINIGLLDPIELCKRVEAEYQKGRAPLNAVEGFIRQIIGWREFIRGIYWQHMPKYLDHNYFNAKRSLPSLYWTGETRMNCLHQCVTQTRDEAYAHHIQRLMVTGNFAMLIGVVPQQIHEWYLAVYADAYEWVELPNTLGMSQFADGGLLGSKPYAAGGNYINKMSDFCKNCEYKVTVKEGENACPFNYLYWHFLIRNKDKLKSNHRLFQPYRTLEKMSDERKAAIMEQGTRFIKAL